VFIDTLLVLLADDTYAYWADMTTVGTVMKAPKAGGGSATGIARDTISGMREAKVLMV
jgi:hypothetical protein